MRLSMISLGGTGVSGKGRKAAESLLCKALPAAGASDIKLALKFALLYNISNVVSTESDGFLLDFTRTKRLHSNKSYGKGPKWQD